MRPPLISHRVVELFDIGIDSIRARDDIAAVGESDPIFHGQAAADLCVVAPQVPAGLHGALFELAVLALDVYDALAVFRPDEQSLSVCITLAVDTIGPTPKQSLQIGLL